MSLSIVPLKVIIIGLFQVVHKWIPSHRDPQCRSITDKTVRRQVFIHNSHCMYYSKLSLKLIWVFNIYVDTTGKN